jgi:xanthine dehydrogenase iron-sulfur cluster and FAD-binding subunit A
MNEMTNSHILVHGFEYLEPGSLDEAISLLREHGDRAQVLAGGTYMLVQIKMERVAPECVINVGRIPGLEGIAPYDGGLRIGALTKIRAVRNAPQVQAGYAALAEACAAFGSTQIQVMGTIGGNLCNGSPASDTVPALMALDAQLVLAGPDGERVLPVEEFLLGPGRTALREGELLVAIELPPSFSPPGGGAGGGGGSAFIKISRVAADLAKASVAAVLVREGDRVVDCRLAFGSVGPTVSRARRAEEVLTGRPFSAELALEAGRVASEDISPIDDVRSTAWYRREVVKALAHDALQVAWERAGEQEAGCRMQDAGCKMQDAGGREQEAGGRKREAGSGKQEAGSRDIRNTQHATRSTLRVGPAETYIIDLTVNGVEHTLSVAPNELLLNVLRERLELTGTKYGCGIGECGACTVHLDGVPALSCLVLAVAADGSEVLTVEGLARPDGELDPLQEAFIEHNAFQCGYCTPGMLMMTKSLLGEIPSPTEDDVRDYLKGNRCRCTGFASIVHAVMHCQRVLDDENGGTHAT